MFILIDIDVKQVSFFFSDYHSITDNITPYLSKNNTVLRNKLLALQKLLKFFFFRFLYSLLVLLYLWGAVMQMVPYVDQ